MEQPTPTEEKLDACEMPLEAVAEKEFPAPRPFRVVFSDRAHDDMWKHARGTLADGETIREVGGILVGMAYRDEGGPYLEVHSIIPAEHTRSEGTEVTFTPDTWAQVNCAKEAQFPDERIVGWYHTHPRFGIFLSDRDKFVHSHSFPQPWAVAFVLDPVQQLEGLFVWSAGEARLTAEYWVGAERKFSDSCSPVAPPTNDAPRAHGISRSVFITTVSIAAIIAAFAVILFLRNEMTLAKEIQLMARALESEDQELERGRQVMTTLREQIDTAARQDNTTATAMQGQLRQLESGLRSVEGITKTLRRRVEMLQRNERPPEPAPSSG